MNIVCTRPMPVSCREERALRIHRGSGCSWQYLATELERALESSDLVNLQVFWIFRSSSRSPLAYPVLVLTGKGEGRVIRTHGSRTGKTGRQITSWTVRKMAPKIKPTVTSKRASPVGTTRPCGPLTPLRRNRVYDTEMKYNRPPKLAGNNIQINRTTSHNTIFMSSCLHLLKPQPFNSCGLQVLIKTIDNENQPWLRASNGRCRRLEAPNSTCDSSLES